MANQKHTKYSLRILIKYTVCKGKKRFPRPRIHLIQGSDLWFKVTAGLLKGSLHIPWWGLPICTSLSVHCDVYHPDLGPHLLPGPPNYSLPKGPSIILIPTLHSSQVDFPQLSTALCCLSNKVQTTYIIKSINIWDPLQLLLPAHLFKHLKIWTAPCPSCNHSALKTIHSSGFAHAVPAAWKALSHTYPTSISGVCTD